MLDVRQIRADPEGTKRRSPAAARRPCGTSTEFLALDARRLELLRAVETARADRNAAAKAIAEAKQRGEDAAAEIARQAELKEQQAAERGGAGGGRSRCRRGHAPHPEHPPPVLARRRRGGGRRDRPHVREAAGVRVRAARPPRSRRAGRPRPDRPRVGRARLGEPVPLPERRPRPARVRAHPVGPRRSWARRGSSRSSRRCS